LLILADSSAKFSSMKTYIDKAIIDSGIKASEIAKRSKLSGSMLWQLRNGHRPANPLHAIELEIGSGGTIKAEYVCPDFFEKLKKIGYDRVDRGDFS